MNAIVYVNTPLEAPEHAALAALARREGRAKGQQLRLLAIQAMRRNPMPAGSDSYAAHVAARELSHTSSVDHGSSSDAGVARPAVPAKSRRRTKTHGGTDMDTHPSSRKKNRAHDRATRARESAAARTSLAEAGDAAEVKRQRHPGTGTSTHTTSKGGRA